MTEAEAKLQLEHEGFRNVSAWLDSPDFTYPEHAHPTGTVHIIIDGEMVVTMDGMIYDVQAGDRIEIQADQAHIARMGPLGCTYVTGEK